MINPATFVARRRRVKAVARDQGLAALVVTHPANVTYLTGFTGSNGQVVLTTTAEDRLVTDRRYDGRVDADEALHVVFEPLAGIIAAHNGPVGIEAHHASWATARRLTDDTADTGVTITATSGLVEQFRRCKDSYEQAQLAAACDITVQAMQHIFAHTRLQGMSEQAIATRVSETLRTFGADGDAFWPIVASGTNGAIAHHSPSKRPVAAGDLLTIDCGARLNGYHADCTRTVAIGHAPQGELATIYTLVRDAQQAATASLLPNNSGHDVDAAARNVIATAGYGPYFVHGTGHGVGLEIHEAPLIGPAATATLEATVTCTSEPGIYLPSVGGVRIEDTVLVTASGAPQILTELTRDLVIV